MITLKQYKKTLLYAVGYSASLATLKRIARSCKVKHVPARQKLKIARRAREQLKAVSFANRYGSSTIRGRNPDKVMYSDLSKLEQRILANMPQEGLNYLAQMSS